MPKRRIVIVKGSPRREGNTAALADCVAEGAKEVGAVVDVFYLHGMNIAPCDACDGCREKIDDDCVVDDDMQLIYPKLRAADALVIASPVYWFSVSAQTKIFMDRCYALAGDDTGEYALKGKEIGIVMTYGDADPFVSGAVNALRTLQDAFRYVGAPIVGMVYGTADAAGEIRENKTVMEAAYALGKRLGAGR